MNKYGRKEKINMGFFSWKQQCGICGEECGLNRWKVSTDNTRLCPKCFKKMGGIKNIEYLTSKSIEEIRNIIEPCASTSVQDFKEEKPISENVKSLQFHVAGVTFKTERRSRQVMLKNMYFKNTPPFDNGIEITFDRYDFNGRLAIGVYANGLQIGNVPKTLVDKFNSYWTCDYNAKFSIVGGGEVTWGCLIDVVFD